MREIQVQRVVDPIAPRQSIGYDVGNAVAMLFDKARRDGLDVTRIDLESIRVKREQDPVTIIVTAQIDYPEVRQQYACGCNGVPHWGPGGCTRA